MGLCEKLVYELALLSETAENLGQCSVSRFFVYTVSEETENGI